MQMHWDTSSVMYPGVIGFFGSFNIRCPHPGDPTGVDQTPSCVPAAVAHGSALLIQSQREAFCAASVADLIAFLLAFPVMPRFLNTLQSDRPANPLQPTSIGSQRVCQPCLLHSSTSSWYLARFLSLASSMRSSQGTLSSNKISCLVESENIITSGRSLVDIILVGIFSCFPRSTSICQSVAVVRRPDFALGCGRAFSPALRNLMLLGLWWPLMVLMAVAMLSASALSTWSWRQR